jgi:hypothetical protein
MKAISVIASPLENGTEFCVSPEMIDHKNEILKISETFSIILGEENAQLCNETLKIIKGCLNYMEKFREGLKAPITAMGKKIDTVAWEYSKPLIAEELRLKSLIGAFIQSQQKQQLQEIRATGKSETEVKVEGVQAMEGWDFEVTNQIQAFTSNPDLFDLTPKRAPILACLKDGINLPGIKALRKTIIKVSQ